ncbi:histidine-containing phosphotransfer protein 2-like isoform X1 [Senna tora]|uniref:Histidine-containing phosphotransfer protein n=1 Tax=Senna tora TaxID=362788 RepID=A0A834WVX8_9FABA|nr:histidine-containing phosphotransfer protein 2-like isoform X1 [Senna tora]
MAEDKDALNKQLLDVIFCMKQEGMVDDHFIYVYSLRENTEDPFFLVALIPEFCSQAREVINQLTHALNNPLLVSCDTMKEYVYKVKGSALSLGASRMAQAFSHFQCAIDNASQEQCIIALNQAKHEFTSLEEKLHVIVQGYNVPEIQKANLCLLM